MTRRLHRYLLSFGLLYCTTGTYAAEYFDERFEPGYELLNMGEYEQALEAFNVLKTETPESALVDYSIASTHYKQAVAESNEENLMETFGMLTMAKEQFDDLARIPDPFLKGNAPFSSAVCSAQIAKLYNTTEEFQLRVDALKIAINEFDKVLLLDSDHESAIRNRDHLSYLLKTLLQSEPQKQKMPNDGEGGDEENESEEKKESEEQGEGEQKEQEEQSEEQQEQEESDQESDAENSNPQEQDEQEQQSSQNGKAPDQANIEAILDSLEDINKEEQKNLRRAEGPPRVNGGKWW